MSSVLSDKNLQFEILKKQTVFQGFFRLVSYELKHQLFAGGWSEAMVREIFERGDSVAVLLYDPVIEHVVLVEQFRVAAINAENGAWLIELVAGMMDDQPTEVARREAVEEAGAEVKHLELVTQYYVSPGGTDEQVWLYCAHIDASNISGIHGLTSEHEDIKVHNIPFDKAWQWLQQGLLNTAPALIAMHWLKMNQARLAQDWQ